ncbi:hypothetical protein C8K36_104239 [Rhodococcus sp. OK519]|uniref:hypothetical protein n=1 Tax=Rhodococcus sp. OK519 TaxID=2135729 RepID=UPI000D44D98E|nr:hypothetical protein C8K36_104239 [Rhodococcus sp. OK519]
MNPKRIIDTPASLGPHPSDLRRLSKFERLQAIIAISYEIERLRAFHAAALAEINRRGIPFDALPTHAGRHPLAAQKLPIKCALREEPEIADAPESPGNTVPHRSTSAHA